jgi:chemosensory pili system protein ChpC
MSNEKTEIRTLLAPVTGGTVMLPGSVIAEVVDYENPKPFKDAPAWLLGGLNWSDWNVPVISFSLLTGAAESEEARTRSRVLVVKSLSENSSIPYLGILISGLPRLAKVTASQLTKPSKLAGFPCVFKQLSFGEEQVLIPDLDELTRTIEQALSGEQAEKVR